MVFFTRILRGSINIKIRPRQSYKRSRFIDSLRIYVMGGPGGMGYPKYGGIGGKGGDVIVQAENALTLKAVLNKYPSKRIVASKGADSHKRCILGRNGDNHVINVPIGINVVDDYDNSLGELNEDGQKLVVAKGGAGGCQLSGFSGVQGERRCVRLLLKLIADIGFVGFPNAGKSTLLKAITNAKPEIASYPFTTVKPHLGIIEYEDFRRITLADLPGLVEGAHKNVGMGHKFLRHLERTKLLLMIVDINGFQLNFNYDFRSCLDTVVLLNKELELYREDLLDKHVILLVNKMDTKNAWETFDSIQNSLRNIDSILAKYPPEYRPRRPIIFDHILPVSAKKSAKDIEVIKETLRTYLDICTYDSQENVEQHLINSLSIHNKEFGPKYF